MAAGTCGRLLTGVGVRVPNLTTTRETQIPTWTERAVFVSSSLRFSLFVFHNHFAMVYFSYIVIVYYFFSAFLVSTTVAHRASVLCIPAQTCHLYTPYMIYAGCAPSPQYRSLRDFLKSWDFRWTPKGSKKPLRTRSSMSSMDSRGPHFRLDLFQIQPGPPNDPGSPRE